MGLQHPAESTRLEFKVKLHSGFLALYNSLFLFPPKTPILPWGDKHKPSSLVAAPPPRPSPKAAMAGGPPSNSPGFFKVVLHPRQSQAGFASEAKPHGAASRDKGTGWQRLPLGWNAALELAEKGQRCFSSRKDTLAFTKTLLLSQRRMAMPPHWRWPQPVPSLGLDPQPCQGRGCQTCVPPRDSKAAEATYHLPQERGERLRVRIEPVFLKWPCFKSFAQAPGAWGDAAGFAGREEEDEAGSHGCLSPRQGQADPCQRTGLAQPSLRERTERRNCVTLMSS